MKRILLTILALASSSVHASFWQNFERIENAAEITDEATIKNDVSIIKLDNNSIMRVSAPKSFVQIPIYVSQDITIKFDWRSNGPGDSYGEIFRIAGDSHTNTFFRLFLIGKKLDASSYFGGKIRAKKLYTIEPLTWYRIKAQSVNNRWNLSVYRRGKHNSPSKEKLVYSTADENKVLRTNKNVTPNMIMFAQWVKGVSFDYDNVSVK